jgi:hypothetical protein
VVSRCGGGSDPTPSGLTRRLTPRWSLPPPHSVDTRRICRRYLPDASFICAGYRPDQFMIVC